MKSFESGCGQTRYDYIGHQGIRHARDAVDDAVRGNPAIIPRHGRPEAVILSFSDWEKLSHIRSFGQLLCEKSDLLYLVDTNILSAAAGRPKSRDLIAWMDAHSPELSLR